LRNLKIPHKDKTIEVVPYKSPNKDVTTNTKNIIKQNNFTNTSLNIIEKQLTRIKKHIQEFVFSPVETTKPVEQKVKNLVFKLYEVTKASQTQIQNTKTYFLKAIKDHLNHLRSFLFHLNCS
jgi:hypothetical protein